MEFIEKKERKTFELHKRLAYTNPFAEERMEIEHQLLGKAKTNSSKVWHIGLDISRSRPEVIAIRDKTKALLELLQRRLKSGLHGSLQERESYMDIVLFYSYDLINEDLAELILSDDKVRVFREEEIFNEFKEHLLYWTKPLPEGPPKIKEIAHLFSICYQVRRAFHYIFNFISGESSVIANLRVNLWQSIFTHDLNRYRKNLYTKMTDFATLITGPSGTGKELVARAIGNSRYLPFDLTTKSFKEAHNSSFFPLNLSALSDNLIESELFGHRKGAFTGALQDRRGYLEECSKYGTVFIDEVGELNESTQVKLLRVFQMRSFQRVGDNKEIPFKGKLIAATNRNLEKEMAEGQFREDFYYRLCSDMIETPSLASILTEKPSDLQGMITFILDKILDEGDQKKSHGEILDWIENHISHDYTWPGNFRELEQCVRSILIRKSYQPRTLNPAADVWDKMKLGHLDLDQVISFYCRHVDQFTDSISESSKRLNVDRRTLQSRMKEHTELG